jgi:hypothetical protein
MRFRFYPIVTTIEATVNVKAPSRAEALETLRSMIPQMNFTDLTGTHGRHGKIGVTSVDGVPIDPVQWKDITK